MDTRTERIKAITTLIVTALLLVNTILTASGRNPIPYSESAAYELISNLLSAIAVIYTWWKNQNVTEEAAKAQGWLNEMKLNKADAFEHNYEEEDLPEEEVDNE